MQYLLDEYYLLNDIVKKSGKSSRFFIRNFEDRTKTIKRKKFIHKSCICNLELKEEPCSLKNLYPLSAFASLLHIKQCYLQKRVEIMKINKKIQFFEFKEIEKIVFIVLDDELKIYLSTLTPFIMGLNESIQTYKSIKAYKQIAHLQIGFY